MISRMWVGARSQGVIGGIPSQYGYGIRAEYFDERRLLAQPVERTIDRRVVAMTFDVDKEHVLPQFGVRRPRFQFGHRHAVLRELTEQVVNRARPIGDRHDQRGLVTPRRTDIVIAEHRKRVVLFGSSSILRVMTCIW